MSKSVLDILKSYIDNSSFTANLTLQGEYICTLPTSNGNQTFSLYSKELKMELRLFYQKNFGINIGQSDIDKVIEYLELVAYKNKLDYELSHRIFYNDNLIIYDLNQQDNSVVWIQDGNCSVEVTESILFARNKMFANQVEPDFDVKPKSLLKLISKHFDMEEKDRKMFALYLVTCFMGLSINHPVIIFVGEKGAGKSTALRKLERIVDPKQTDLCGIPKGADGLELRLSNSYFVALDNLSFISRNVSDTLARAVTGGSVTKRALYQNTEEISLNIKALLAINSVSMVVKESDLLDRSLLINLKRIRSDDVKTEKEIWQEFENDLPKILGCCFKTLAEAMQDTSAINSGKLIRMADFHVACIRVGRVLGFDEQEVSELIWRNQKNINRQSLDEDMVALCLIELMSDRKNYKNSVTMLLCDLIEVAENNGISSSVLPRTPNHLSKRLNKIKSNLETECGITYRIVNVGTFKEIRINKK